MAAAPSKHTCTPGKEPAPMDRFNRPSFDPPPPYDPTKKLSPGPSQPHDPGEARFVAEWLARVAVGNIGGKTPVNEEARAIVLANERLMFGRQRTILD